jgi:rhamnosyltransferase
LGVHECNSSANIIVAVIVSYNPEPLKINKLISVVMPQVNAAIIVDNASKVDISNWDVFQNNQKLHCLKLTENFGIAKAQNIGITWAQAQGCSYVLLLDQDSLPSLDMVAELLRAMEQKIAEGYDTAAVGANYSDIKGQLVSPFVKLTGYKLHRIPCNNDDIVAVDHLIASGSLISMAAVSKIGVMEEGLFIDYVDTEWCLRALHHGYSLFGVGAAHMQHDLGDRFVHLLGKTIPVHAPFRYYYLIRNGIWLLRQPWVSKNWQLMDMRRLLLIYIAYSLFVSPRYKNWKMMTLGLWHGLKGEMGKLS